MKSLFQYIMEATSVTTVLHTYMDNLDKLSIIRKQHFLTRLSLCDLPEAKDLSLSSGIDDVIKTTNDVLDMFKAKKYKDIVSKYVIIPYDGINKEKDKIKEWILSFDDEKTNHYFALGYLSEKLDIIERTDNVDKIKRWSEIYDYYDCIDDMVKFHNEDKMDCTHKCGTIYVNFIGNAYYVLKSQKLKFPKKIDINDWRRTRKIFSSMKDFNNISVYGVTHSIINGCRYYTKPLDKNEFITELDFLDDFLVEMAKNDYKISGYVTLDLLCESALCERLANDNKYSQWRKVLKHMDTLVDPKTNIIQSNNRFKDDVQKNLENNEHTNILYILLNSYKLNRK